MICPACGNDDENKMLTDTEPLLDRKGRITGFTLTGFHCGVCGEMVSHPVCEPADASPSGAH